MLKAAVLRHAVLQKVPQHAQGLPLHGLGKARIRVGIQIQGGKGDDHLRAALRTGIARALVLVGQPLQRFIDGGVHGFIAAVLIVGCQRLQRHGGHVHVADRFCVGAGAPAAVRILLAQNGLHQPGGVGGVIAAVERQQTHDEAVDIRVTGIGDLHDIPVLQRRQQVYAAHVGGVLADGGKGQGNTLIVGDDGVMALGIAKNAVRAHILPHIGHNLIVVGLNVCIGQLHAGASLSQHRPLAEEIADDRGAHRALDIRLGAGIRLIEAGHFRTGHRGIRRVQRNIGVGKEQAQGVTVLEIGVVQRGLGQSLGAALDGEAEHPSGGLAVALLLEGVARRIGDALDVGAAAGIGVVGTVQARLHSVPSGGILVGLAGEGKVGNSREGMAVFVVAVHLDLHGEGLIFVGVSGVLLADHRQVDVDGLLVELGKVLVAFLGLLGAVDAELFPILGVLGVGQNAVQRNCRIVLRLVHTQELILDDGGSGGSEAAVLLRIEPAGDIVGLDAVEGHIHRTADVFQRAVLVFADLREGIQVGGDLGLIRILVPDAVPVGVLGQRLCHKVGGILQFLLLKGRDGEGKLLPRQQKARAAGGDGDHILRLHRLLTGQRAVDHGVIAVEVQHIGGEAHHRDLLVIAVAHDARLLQKSGSGHLHIVADGIQIHGLCLIHKVTQEPLILLRQSGLHLAGHAAVEGRNGGVKEHIGIDLHAVVAGDVRQRVVIEAVIGHAGDQPELAGLLGQRRAVGGLQGAVDGAHAGAVGAVGDVEPLGVPGAPLHLHIIAPRNAGGKREVGGDAVVHGVERPARHLALGGPVGILAADEFPVQGLGGALHQLLHSIGAASHGASQGDLLGDPGIGDVELQSRVLHGLAGGAVTGEVGDVAVVGNVLYLGTVKAVGLGAAVDIGDLGVVRHIRIALFPQQAAEGVGDVGLIIEPHTLQGLHGNIFARELGGNVLQGLRLFRILGPEAQREGLGLRGSAALEGGGEGHRDLIRRRRGERAGGGVHQSVIRRPCEGNGLFSTALHGNGDARGQGQEAGIGLRGLLFLLRVAAHRGKAAELIDAGGIGLQKVCILGIESQFLIEVLLQGGQEVVVRVRDLFAGLFDAVFLAEVGLITIVLKVIESQHILGVPVGLGFLGGIGGAHAAKLHGVGGGGSGLEVGIVHGGSALPGQHREAAVAVAAVKVHPHIRRKFRGAHFLGGLLRGTDNRCAGAGGMEVVAVFHRGAGCHEVHHRADAGLRTGDGAGDIAIAQNGGGIHLPGDTADALVGASIRSCGHIAGGIAVLHGAIGIAHDAADIQRGIIVGAGVFDVAGVDAVDNAVAFLGASHDAAGRGAAAAGGHGAVKEAVLHGAVTGGRDAAHMTAAADCADDRQVLHRAGGGKAAHQSLRALQAADDVPIAVQRPGKAGLALKFIIIFAKSRPGLAVEVDVGGEFGADGGLPVLDGIGKPGQLRGGIDQVDTALVLRGRGLGRAVPSLTGIGQCYRDGVVFGSGKAAADRDIVRLGDGIGIRLAGVDDVCAVLVCCDRAAHGVGHGHRGVRRSYGKGQGTGGKFAQRDGLVHIGANGDVPRLGLVAELADGVGIGTGGNGVCAVFAGDLRAATVLQHHRCTVGSVKGEGVGCGGGKILEPDIVTAATFAERQGEFFILIQHRAKGFPTVLLVGCQQSSTLFHGKGRIVFP